MWDDSVKAFREVDVKTLSRRERNMGVFAVGQEIILRGVAFRIADIKDKDLILEGVGFAEKTA
jgi:hypothetical protein